MAMSEFMPLTGLDRPHLKESSYKGAEPAFIENGNVFETIRQGDVLLYHPTKASRACLTSFVERLTIRRLSPLSKHFTAAAATARSLLPSLMRASAASRSRQLLNSSPF